MTDASTFVHFTLCLINHLDEAGNTADRKA